MTLIRFMVEQDPRGFRSRDGNGLLPLHSLCKAASANVKSVEYLVKAYPDAVTARTNVGKVPLTLACEAKANLAVVHYLMRCKPDLVLSLRNSSSSSAGVNASTTRHQQQQRLGINDSNASGQRNSEIVDDNHTVH